MKCIWFQNVKQGWSICISNDKYVCKHKTIQTMLATVALSILLKSWHHDANFDYMVYGKTFFGKFELLERFINEWIEMDFVFKTCKRP